MKCRFCDNASRTGLKTCAACGLRNSLNCKAWRVNNPEKWKELHRDLYIRRHVSKGRGKLEATAWIALCAQYGDRCVACGKHKTELEKLGRMLVPDHVLSLADGGMNAINNIQPLCHSLKIGAYGCNNLKGRRHIDFRIPVTGC